MADVEAKTGGESLMKQITCPDERHNGDSDYPCVLPCDACQADDCDKPKFYECGICGHYHPVKWDSDCRDDANRFTGAELDDTLGPSGWEEVPMPETGEAKHGKGFSAMEKINFSGTKDPTEHIRKLRED